MCTDHITNNLTQFKNTKNVLILDRAYFSYIFLKFLIDNNILFIVRIRGKGDSLNNETPLKKNKNCETIEFIRKNIRLVKCDSTIKKIIPTYKNKKNTGNYELTITNDCIVITNLMDITIHSNKDIIELYRKRWDIEVFFKLLKNNCKMRHLDEKNIVNHKKIYCCSQVIMNIVSTIEHLYFKNNNIEKTIIKRKKVKDKIITTNCDIRINKTNLITGIYELFSNEKTR